MQRDVTFQLENIDKYGNGYGTLWVNNKNFAKPLLEKGFIKFEAKSKSSEYSRNYEDY